MNVTTITIEQLIKVIQIYYKLVDLQKYSYHKIRHFLLNIPTKLSTNHKLEKKFQEIGFVKVTKSDRTRSGLCKEPLTSISRPTRTYGIHLFYAKSTHSTLNTNCFHFRNKNCRINLETILHPQKVSV